MSEKKDPFEKTRVPRALLKQRAKEEIDTLVGNVDVPLEALTLARSILIPNHQRVVDEYVTRKHRTHKALAKYLEIDHCTVSRILARPDVARYLELYNKYHHPNNVRTVDDILLRKVLEEQDLKAIELFYRRWGMIRPAGNVVATQIENHNSDGSYDKVQIIIEGV